jgi:3-deoxy-manno-octulosonate cytidylyltransferase (CMP-KDO synthetase)
LAIVAIIPARFGSTRLPGKPLSEIHGKPMIQHVHERARQARRVDRVLVATDDERIVEAVGRFGGEAVLTAAHHATGTDRVAEVAARLDATLIVNLQGDEPFVDPATIDAIVAPLLEEPDLAMSTAAVLLRGVEEMLSPSVVKVVTDLRGNALLFSRSPIPFVRGAGPGDARTAAEEAVRAGLARRHLGLYAHRREALLQLARLPPTPLEEAERLEQLRALQHGMSIRVVPAPSEGGISVDTPADLERARAFMASGVI